MITSALVTICHSMITSGAVDLWLDGTNMRLTFLRLAPTDILVCHDLVARMIALDRRRNQTSSILTQKGGTATLALYLHHLLAGRAFG